MIIHTHLLWCYDDIDASCLYMLHQLNHAGTCISC